MIMKLHEREVMIRKLQNFKKFETSGLDGPAAVSEEFWGPTPSATICRRFSRSAADRGSKRVWTRSEFEGRAPALGNALVRSRGAGFLGFSARTVNAASGVPLGDTCRRFV